MDLWYLRFCLSSAVHFFPLLWTLLYGLALLLSSPVPFEPLWSLTIIAITWGLVGMSFLCPSLSCSISSPLFSPFLCHSQTHSHSLKNHLRGLNSSSMMHSDLLSNTATVFFSRNAFPSRSVKKRGDVLWEREKTKSNEDFALLFILFLFLILVSPPKDPV